jgi:hypothetical protein
MNRLLQSSASAGGVITDYVGTSLQGSASRKRSRKRNHGYPGFRIRMMASSVEEIRAVVECTGIGLSQFVYYALLRARDETAAKIGMAPHDIARLSKRARAEIRRKYRLAMIVNMMFEPERN